MAQTAQERQAAHRERQKDRGCKQVALYLPEKVLRNIDAEVKRRPGMSRSDVVEERLKPKPKKSGYTPAGQAEIKRLIKLAGAILKQTKSQTAKQTINKLMEGLVELAGRV